MGMLVNGTWFDDDPLPADGGGAFLRPNSSFRQSVIRMLNTEFDAFGDDGLDLYPAALRPEIDEIKGFIYDNINNGVYRAGLAKSQAA